MLPITLMRHNLGGMKRLELLLIVPQTIVLPLHYKPHSGGRAENRTLIIEIMSLAWEPTLPAILGQITRIELVFLTWQASVLPLNYICIWHPHKDLNPNKQFWRLLCYQLHHADIEINAEIIDVLSYHSTSLEKFITLPIKE